MRTDDVERIVLKALGISGLTVDERPKLLSNNGSCHVSGDLYEFLDQQSITHVRGKPLHPQTQGKIERYHESSNNVTPAVVYFGWDK